MKKKKKKGLGHGEICCWNEQDANSVPLSLTVKVEDDEGKVGTPR